MHNNIYSNVHPNQSHDFEIGDEEAELLDFASERFDENQIAPLSERNIVGHRPG